MKRFLQHIIIRLLLVGLLGPVTAFACSLAVRFDVFEEEQDASNKEIAVFRGELRLAAGRGTVPCCPFRQVQHAQRFVARVLPPAQVTFPRVIVVWEPWREGSDDKPPYS